MGTIDIDTRRQKRINPKKTHYKSKLDKIMENNKLNNFTISLFSKCFSCLRYSNKSAIYICKHGPPKQQELLSEAQVIPWLKYLQIVGKVVRPLK